MNTSKVVATALTMAFCAAQGALADTSSSSGSSALQGGVQRTKVTHKSTTYHSSAAKNKTYLQSHPKVKGAAVGGLAGAGAGAVAGLVSGKGIMRGAVIGAGTGAGVGLLQTSKTMKAHPMIKDTAQGTLVGAGLGMAVHRGHGTARTAVKAGAVGGVVGLGAGFLRKELDK